ncbi:gluconolaconase [Acidipila sp. 4G-K13]|uniref:Gluconolaconase n=2 Tax=Paracidobacterium acidisoli TaxID=2303751 RepID=A0A372IV70_9BACT|nr:gluconolaconase [Paracidobacterium acidisoli]MBT9329636.1 gluconolaconase [Paracidobacterium acidisoli]
MPRILKSDPGGAPRIEAVVPDAALPGGELEVSGANLAPVAWRRPVAMLGELSAPVLLSRSQRMVLRVPEEAQSGRLRVLQNGAQSNGVEVQIATPIATGVHAVANPAVDQAGNIYVTFSGQRGQETPVSVFRIGRDNELRPFVTGVMNATGLAVDQDGLLYISSRQEGTVYSASRTGVASVYAEGMGVATGLAFDGEGNLYVGDRSGTIFKIAPDRQIFVFATLEPSVAAYHLAFGQEGTLYVAGPTASSHDAVYAIDRDGNTRVFYRGLGRPQGMAVDIAGSLYVAASLHGHRGIVRITQDGEASLAVSGSGIVGFCFVPGGGALLATASAVYHVALGIEGWRLF